MANYPASQPGSKRHTLSVLVENRPGVLARIAGLFARRAFNINSLSVSPTDVRTFPASPSRPTWRKCRLSRSSNSSTSCCMC